MSMKEDIKDSLVYSFPVGTGYIPLGMAFAILWVNEGLPWYLAPVASIFAYAGAMQFVLVALLASNASLLTVAITTFVVNLRHIFYGFSYPKDKMKNHIWLYTYGIFSLTDEVYSLVSSNKNMSTWMIFFTQVWCQIYWIIGTLLGVLVGFILPKNLIGFEFALVALFAVLAQGYFYEGNKNLVMLYGLLAAMIAFLGFREHQLVIAMGIFVVFLSFFLRTKGSHE